MKLIFYTNFFACFICVFDESSLKNNMYQTISIMSNIVSKTVTLKCALFNTNKAHSCEKREQVTYFFLF